MWNLNERFELVTFTLWRMIEKGEKLLYLIWNGKSSSEGLLFYESKDQDGDLLLKNRKSTKIIPFLLQDTYQLTIMVNSATLITNK